MSLSVSERETLCLFIKQFSIPFTFALNTLFPNIGILTNVTRQGVNLSPTKIMFELFTVETDVMEVNLIFLIL